MENKYYTPELEEFCVGFEYELKLKQEWEKNNFTCESEFEIITTLYIGTSNLKNIIQVKQLDREDIESLGWKLGFSSWDRETHEREVLIMEPWTYMESSAQFELVINEQNVWQLVFGETIKIVHAKLSESKIGLMSGGKTIVEPKNYIEFHVKFDGVLKNKTELSKLMKQLNIKTQ